MQVRCNQTLKRRRSHVVSAWKTGKAKAASRCQVVDVSCASLIIEHGMMLIFSCLPCLSACWTLAITEGSLENVFCPSVVCTKERATKDSKADNADKGVTPALVQSVVGKALRERWERIKENRIIETGESPDVFFGQC